MSKGTRFIHPPELPRGAGILPIPKGGDDGASATEGAINLDLLTFDMLNQANGVAGSDVNNKLSPSVIPSELSAGVTVNITGPTSLEVGQTGTFVITDYDSTIAYNIVVINGTFVRVGNIIYYTAPNSGVTCGFSINGRTINLPLTTSYSVNTPVITSPTNNATNQSLTLTLTSNAFVMSGGSDTHEGSDWQIATDSSFNNIVSQVSNNSSNKVSYIPTGLGPATTYYARVRYKATLYGYSNWSTTLTFTTQVASSVNTPIITFPTNNATNQALTLNLTSSAFAVNIGSDTHEGSDWQIATDSGFSNIVSQVVNSSSDKTTRTVSGLSGGVTYYARVRYKGLAYGYSSWSTTVVFTTSAIPTYAVAPSTGATTYNEGSSITFNITTTNVANGTTLYWSMNGTGIAAGDFSPSGLNGSVTINNNQATLTRTIVNDVTTEGNETFVFNLRTGSVSGTIVASTVSLTITDTSISPNTAPVISGLVNTSGQSSAIQYTTLQSNRSLYTNLFPDTISLSDVELDSLADWSGASINCQVDFSSTSGNSFNFTPVVSMTGGTITFVPQVVSGQTKYLVKWNNIAIGEYILGGSGTLDITFGTLASKLVGAQTITNTHVKDTLKSIGFNVLDGTSPAINFTTTDTSYISVQLTINDGNTGAQGSGGNGSSVYTIRMCAPNGTYVSQYCSGSNSVYKYADANGGVTSQTFVNSTTCGYLGNDVRQAVVLSSGDYLLASETRITRVTPTGVLVDTFGTNGYKSFSSNNNQIPNLYKDRILADHYLVLDDINYSGGIIRRYDADGNLVDTFPGSGSQQTIEKINTDLASSIVCVGYTDVGVSDYRVNIFGKSHTDGTNNTTIYPVKTDSGLLITRILISSGNIFLLGRYNDGTNNYIYIQKRSSISTIDNSFGNNGEFTFVAGIGGDDGYPVDFCINTNGDILILGSGSVLQNCIIKVNSNGTLDTGFGDNGKLQIYRGYWDNNFANIKTDGTNRIYVLSNVGSIRRYSSSGAQDTTYGGLTQGFGGDPDQYVTYSHLMQVNGGFIRVNDTLSNCLIVDSSGNTVAPILIDVHRLVRNNSNGSAIT